MPVFIPGKFEHVEVITSVQRLRRRSAEEKSAVDGVCFCFQVLLAQGEFEPYLIDIGGQLRGWL